MREYSEYVINKYNDWLEKYEIPEHMEFEIKTLFELEEQFQEQPKENVRTKKDILDMITRINSRFPRDIFKKKEKQNDGEKVEIIIAVTSFSRQLFGLLRELHDDNIKKVIDSNGYWEINIGKYVLKLIEKNNITDRTIGRKCHYYINLTGDYDFENKVLRRMVY